MSRRQLTLAELVEQATARYEEMVEAGTLDPPTNDIDLTNFTPIAVFRTEQVTHSTSQWGDLRLTLQVPRAAKYQAIGATDFPGTALTVVVFAPTGLVEDVVGDGSYR